MEIKSGWLEQRRGLSSGYIFGDKQELLMTKKSDAGTTLSSTDWMTGVCADCREREN